MAGAAANVRTGAAPHGPLLLTGVALFALCLASVAAFMSGRAGAIPFLLAYTGGMVMLLTPCRFPVVLAVVPLCKKGSLVQATTRSVVFGAGLVLTQAAWGLAIAAAGEMFGLREVARYLSLLGAGVAYLLGLWALGLVDIPLPSGGWLAGGAPIGSGYIRAFTMGLLLGNTGLCCPDPVFLSLMPFIAARGEWMDGAALGAVYGLGRATPLVAIVLVARAGTDALALAVRHKETFEQAMGWGLVAVGTFTLWGYSGIPSTLALPLMLVPVIIYHLKVRSPLPQAAAWVVAAAVATELTLRLAPSFMGVLL